jgi:hypothetical protein
LRKPNATSLGGEQGKVHMTSEASATKGTLLFSLCNRGLSNYEQEQTGQNGDRRSGNNPISDQ